MNKKILTYLTLASLVLVPSSDAFAQSKVRLKSATRFEITNELDKNPEADAVAFLAPYKQRVDSILLPVVGYSETFMKSGVDLRPESALGNFMADTFFDESERYGQKADFVILNMGGNRADIPEGVVRNGDILALAPFNNLVAFVTLKGSDVVRLFEDIAFTGGECQSRNVRLEITRDKKLRKATINGEPVDPDKEYVICTTDYMAEGNDYLEHFKKSIKKEIKNVLAREVILNYIKRLHSEGRKISAAKDGRCKLVE